jgi:GT2 family glycosyltransferase
MIGDTLFSWRLERLGIPIWFAPQSVVEHEHTDTWGELLRQMYGRGREFGHARRTVQQWSRLRTLGMTVASILPLRLAKIVMRVLWNAARARMLGRYVTTCPIILTGHVARLAGEVAGYFRRPGESCASCS